MGLARPGTVLAAAIFLGGCALMTPGGKTGGAGGGPAGQGDAEARGSSKQQEDKKFAEPTELDQMLDAKPLTLAPVK